MLEGHLEVLIEDSDRGSRTLYCPISDDGRVPLRFIVDPPDFTTGTRVRVRGLWEADGTSFGRMSGCRSSGQGRRLESGGFPEWRRSAAIARGAGLALSGGPDLESSSYPGGIEEDDSADLIDLSHDVPNRLHQVERDTLIPS